MKLTVFGASGAIGRLVVEKALAQGHEVVAFVRRADSLAPQPGLTVVVGALTDEGQVRQAVRGAGAVISALGPSLHRPADPEATPIADGHRVIVAALAREAVARLVTLATPAVQAPTDVRTLATTLPPVLARRFLPWAYRDIVAAGEVVTSSGLDWTVVRIINPNLPDRGRSYGTWVGQGPVRLGVSRQNAAACLLESATQGRFIGQMPIVFDGKRPRA